MPRADGTLSADQRPEADVNIEFQSTAKFADRAMRLAFFVRDANEKYATDYPAAVGPHMTNTDSTPFMDLVPAISLRENERGMGIAFVDGVAASDAIVIGPLDPTLRGLVLMTVSSDQFVAATAQTMREGSKMPRADWKQMQQYLVPLPPPGLLQTFEGAIHPIVEQLKILTFADRRIRAARDLLLPRLMSGEIAV